MDYYWYKLPSFPFHMTTTCYKLKQFFFQIQSQNPQKIMRYFHCTGGKAKTCWLNGVTQAITSELMMSKGQRKHMLNHTIIDWDGFDHYLGLYYQVIPAELPFWPCQWRKWTETSNWQCAICSLQFYISNEPHWWSQNALTRRNYKNYKL